MTKETKLTLEERGAIFKIKKSHPEWMAGKLQENLDAKRHV